jgi:hypothetical protein
MTWTVTNLLIEIIAGIAGAHIAAVAASEHSFGRLGHSIVGVIGGGFSGYFLQTSAAVTVNTNGTFNEPRLFAQVVVHSLAGATVGGILMLIVGFLKYSADTHRASKS